MTVPPPPPPSLPGNPPAQAAGPVTCYRHADRPTKITCSRCGRPICPDCMNDAPVGFHCPVCVKEGRASAPRTMTGARMAGRTGAISFFLVAVNVLVYAVHGPGDVPRGQGDWALWPNKVKYLHEYYRLFSAGFVHFGVIHIAFNMIALISIGPQLEAMLGRWRFSALYGLSLMGGWALSYLLLPTNPPGGGAPGAIFGLMGGLLVCARRMNYDPRQLNGWILYSLAFSFIPGVGID